MQRSIEPHKIKPFKLSCLLKLPPIFWGGMPLSSVFLCQLSRGDGFRLHTVAPEEILKQHMCYHQISKHLGISRDLFHCWFLGSYCSVQFSSVAQLCPTLCEPINCSTPDLPVHHQLPESTQTHGHWVGDAIQPSHPLLSPFLPTFNLSHNQVLFKLVSSSHQVTKVLEFQLQHQSLKWIFRTEFL